MGMKKGRNPVVRKMMERAQSAGCHPDEKKEKDKNICREPIDEEEWEELSQDDVG